MTEPEELLRRLLEQGFFESESSLVRGILWGWKEDVTVAEILGSDFEQKLRAYMPANRERVYNPLPK